jgi:hypothetical protein
MNAPQCLTIEGLETQCQACLKPLCLRQQVINLALGHENGLSCLSCLAKAENKKPEELLSALKDYIKRRDCFSIQWKRYKDVEYCPDPENCYPKTCFQE